jgi:hypothetical protein
LLLAELPEKVGGIFCASRACEVGDIRRIDTWHGEAGAK